MSIRKMALVGALGLSMASAPVLAQTSAPTSLVQRSGADMDEANLTRHGTTTYIIVFFVIIAIGIGIYTAVHNNGDGPRSP